jgi:hypothetical protein
MLNSVADIYQTSNIENYLKRNVDIYCGCDPNSPECKKAKKQYNNYLQMRKKKK